ncbi:hypothetical protein RJ55_01760 [Drechmeria coniospora]|nr:hypothetical protein RJ55_01760 [Drechmeria coniospora]
MESLSDTKWDVVISGTGLQQSLLALALSRSEKNILHVDHNDFYGESEAALSLHEADVWAQRHAAHGEGIFSAAEVTKDDAGLSFSRAYSLALAPQLIHARSDLLSQLVSSKAFRQVEFLAVGSFFIYQDEALSRIPSTREDVFVNTTISARSKRALMKFLKFVLEYDSEPQVMVWKAKASEPLVDFLLSDFKLDRDLRSYVVTLTLSLDERIPVEAGLAAIKRHLTSMGVFGPGFAAVYPKWGGISEIAQVGCRAGAVGGAVYMLGTGVSGVETAEDELEIKLTNDLAVRTKTLVQGASKPMKQSPSVSRLTAVVASDFSSLFETTIEGSPTPCVAVVAFPSESVVDSNGTSNSPIYALVHSSDTGECPAGQCTIYLSTVSTPRSKDMLDAALSCLLATSPEPVGCLYKLRYDQKGGTGSFTVDGGCGTFGLPPLDLAFNDSALASVREAWDMVVPNGEGDYMQFNDREGAFDEDAVGD